MRLSYSSRSRFFAPLEREIPKDYQRLPHEIEVALGPGGYGYDLQVDVSANDPEGFDTDWEGRDPTRFPARARAAATVLQRRGYLGRFRIFLRNGRMVIQPLHV